MQVGKLGRVVSFYGSSTASIKNVDRLRLRAPHEPANPKNNKDKWSCDSPTDYESTGCPAKACSISCISALLRTNSSALIIPCTCLRLRTPTIAAVTAGFNSVH